MTTAVPIVRADGEGERRRFWGGGILTMKATADETGGAFLLFDDAMTQGKTTPLHVHADEDEALYVLEGEILVHIDGTDHRVGAHGFAMAPRGVPARVRRHLTDRAGADAADAGQRGGVLPRGQRAGRRRQRSGRPRRLQPGAGRGRGAPAA